MRKKREIFVSYHFSNNQGHGFGNSTQFYSYRDYISPKEIREMESVLKKEGNFNNIVILNYKIM